MASAWYKDWFGTDYYKALYSARDEEEARTWVASILHSVPIEKGATVLDMACGRGRHVQWFVEAGMSTTGIDISAESIVEAKVDVPQADLHVHDIRVPYALNKFDLVVSLFTSLGYFEDPADDRRVIEAAFAALRPNGHFILDFMNAPKAVAELVKKETIERGGVQFMIHREVKDGRILKTISVIDGEVNERYQESVRVISPAELRSMVRSAGFTIHAEYGDVDGSDFDIGSSDRLVIWAIRP